MKEASLYEKLPDGKVRCLACKWKCVIAEGKTGICGVRRNDDGKLNLLVWGKAISANLDPVEKKPLFHFLPGTKIFSIGTVGCNFGCEFCQNWDISQASKGLAKRREFLLENPNFTASDYGYDLRPKEIVDYCLENRIKSIAFTYNEPTIFAEYARDVIKAAKSARSKAAKGARGETKTSAHRIKGVFVSNGFESEEALDFLEGYIDAYNIDLKGFSEKFYKKVCKGKLKPVLDTIKSIHKRGKWIELTTLLIPSENDSDEEIKQIAEFIAGVSTDIPWHISAFHPDYRMQDRGPTPAETLFRAYEIGKKAGLKFVYTGNIDDNKRDNTFCPKCKTKLIEREGYNTKILRLEDGKCQVCKTAIPGIWK